MVCQIHACDIERFVERTKLLISGREDYFGTDEALENAG